MSASHFVKDSAHHFESGLQGNNGYITRHKDVAGSRLFDFSIIPHIDFLHTPRVIPANIAMKLKLTRSPDSFSILSKSNSDLYVKIHSLNLFVYRVQPTEEIRRLHDKLFMKKMHCFQPPKLFAKSTLSPEVSVLPINQTLSTECYPDKSL